MRPSTIIGFIAGFGAGFGVCYFVLNRRNKYEDEYYDEYEDDYIEDDENEDEDEYNKEIKRYSFFEDNMSKDEQKNKSYDKPVNDYSKYYGYSSETEKYEEITPRLVTEEEFKNSYYEKKGLTLYSDGKLVDDNYKVLEDHDTIDYMIGKNLDKLALDTNVDAKPIWILNEGMQVCYEIVKDERRWCDIVAGNPYGGVLHEQERILKR